MNSIRVLITFILINLCLAGFCQTNSVKIGIKEIDSINKYLINSKKTEINDKEFISKFCDSTVFSFSPDFLNSIFYLNFRSCLLLYRNFLAKGGNKSIEFQRFIKDSYSYSTDSKDNKSETLYEYLVYDQSDDKNIYFFLIWVNNLGRLKMITTSIEAAKKFSNN